jgi:DNA repair ATPase RecN
VYGTATLAMKIERLRLQQFTAFEDVDLAFSPGVNVFLGVNGTGKSHAMKVAYAFVEAMREPASDLRVPKLQEKLSNVFQLGGDLDRLVRRAPPGSPSDVEAPPWPPGS